MIIRERLRQWWHEWGGAFDWRDLIALAAAVCAVTGFALAWAPLGWLAAGFVLAVVYVALERAK